MSYDKHGYRYLKTGDESGDLCVRCDVPLLIDKTGKKEKGKHAWKLWCRCCGRTIPFVSEYDREAHVYL